MQSAGLFATMSFIVEIKTMQNGVRALNTSEKWPKYSPTNKKQSAVDIVINRIVDDVLTGRYKPGDKLPTEMQLAEMMSMSKNTVREAIKILVAYGAVEIRRPEGTFITHSFTPKMLNPVIYSLLFSKSNADDLAGGNMTKGLELVMDGTVQMDIHSTSIISSIDKRLMVSCLPWTFSDYQAAEDAFFGAGGEFVSSVLAEHGLTYLGALHNGFKCMTSSKCQIKAPSDLVGQKIRTPGGDLWNGFWSALGASPQAMSWSEVYTAMQQKTIDGHDNSPSTINSANVQEVQKYITVSNHTYEAFTWSANSDWYNGLNEATQELIASCAKQACLDANKQIEDSMEKILSNWEGNGYNEIYRLSDSEIEVFKEAVASVTEQYANEYGQEACTAFGINVAS